MPKTDLTSMTLPALTEWVTGTLGEPKFRAGQIYRWVHQKRVGSFGAKAGGHRLSHHPYHPAAAGKPAG